MNQPFGPIALARLLICLPFFVMLFLMLVEAALSATTTYLVIETGRDVAKGTFRLADLMWILAAQSAAYVIGAVSWIFAERTGFLAYGRYMLRFARDNRTKTKLSATRTRATGSSRFSPGRRSTSISICSTRSRAIWASCWR
jgi:hypothetical protein